MDFVSIICPIYNEQAFIGQCILSMLAQDFPRNKWELLLIDGGSSDSTRQLILPYTQEYNNIHLIDNPHRIVPFAMNIGIGAALGDYICRIDAHSSFPSNYISTLVRYMKHLPDASNVGAVCKTEPRNNSHKARAIASVLSNRFGVGNSAFRVGISEVTAVDTVPFGFYKREVLEKVGLYNERLTRNQDIELNKRIIANGGKVYLVPDTYCIYYARATYLQLALNNFGNGKWNLLTVYYTHDYRSLSLRHFIPLLFILSLLLPLCIMPLWQPIGWLSALSLFSYLLLINAVALKEAIMKHLHFLAILWAFIVLHISYGVGSLVGLITLPFLKRK